MAESVLEFSPAGSAEKGDFLLAGGQNVHRHNAINVNG